MTTLEQIGDLEAWHVAIACLLILLPGAVMYGQIRFSGLSGTDQKFHFLLVEQIRRNHRRFVRRHDFFLISPGIIYPQLLHWCLSFLSEKGGRIAGRYVSVLVVTLSTTCLACFTTLIYPHLQQYGIDYPSFLVTTLALYSLTPYSYDPTNAKNVGMSARAVGLLLVELYLYGMTLFILGDGSVFLLLALASLIGIMLSSIFALQFVIFSAPILAIALSSPSYLVAPVAALAAFFLMMPAYATAYFKGQYLHKKSYYRYAARPFLLDPRPGIWRDLVWDFWKSIIKGPRPGAQGGTTARYIALNPVVVAAAGFPAVVLLTGMFVAEELNGSGTMSASLVAMPELIWPIISCLILFVATSFRMTRFLGEPQRYVECGTGFLCIVAAIALGPHPYLLTGLLLFQCLYITAHLVRVFASRRGTTARKDRTGALDEVLERLEENDSSPIRVLSNNLAITLELMSLNRRVFYGHGLPDSFAGIPTNEVLGNYPVVSPRHVEMLTVAFEIDYLVLDERLGHDDCAHESDFKGISLEKIHAGEELTLFRVHPRT